jgi:hypothetical protein
VPSGRSAMIPRKSDGRPHPDSPPPKMHWLRRPLPEGGRVELMEIVKGEGESEKM